MNSKAAVRILSTHAPLVKILEILKILIKSEEQVLILKVRPLIRIFHYISGQRIAKHC